MSFRCVRLFIPSARLPLSSRYLLEVIRGAQADLSELGSLFQAPYFEQFPILSKSLGEFHGAHFSPRTIFFLRARRVFMGLHKSKLN